MAWSRRWSCPGTAFVLAVQWHPEEILDDLRLFAAIVEAARSYAGGQPDEFDRN